MRMSSLFGRRLRETGSGIESASHDLLLRAGYVRQHAAGIYVFLPPGLRSLRRIEGIIREEMDRTGAQEILMSVVHSADPWKATGRWAAIDQTLVRFRDRGGRDMVLGMTHEEIVAQLAAGDVTSYRQAGVIVYQIQTKFRDEARPRAGLLRTREFVMKDAYSLHVEQAGLEAAYAAQSEAYTRIFRRLGLRDVHRVRSGTGDMGGLAAHEFVALLEIGEDQVILCPACGDAANVELLAGSRDCPACASPVEARRAVEVGNIFQLGTRYSEALGAYVADAGGARRALVMGSYGIGVSRLLAVLVEQHRDDRGITLPVVASPFDAHIVAIDEAGNGAAQLAGPLYEALGGAGLDVLWDDRGARAGEQFTDADLIGAPLRLTIGRRAARHQRIEIRERRNGSIHDISVADAVAATLRIREALERRESAAVPAGT